MIPVDRSHMTAAHFRGAGPHARTCVRPSLLADSAGCRTPDPGFVLSCGHTAVQGSIRFDRVICVGWWSEGCLESAGDSDFLKVEQVRALWRQLSCRGPMHYERQQASGRRPAPR